MRLGIIKLQKNAIATPTSLYHQSRIKPLSSNPTSTIDPLSLQLQRHLKPLPVSTLPLAEHTDRSANSMQRPALHTDRQLEAAIIPARPGIISIICIRAFETPLPRLRKQVTHRPQRNLFLRRDARQRRDDLCRLVALTIAVAAAVTAGMDRAPREHVRAVRLAQPGDEALQRRPRRADAVDEFPEAVQRAPGGAGVEAGGGDGRLARRVAHVVRVKGQDEGQQALDVGQC